MTALALIFTLASVGISETVYLIRKRKAEEAPLCFIGEDCSVVLQSRYQKIFLVPNDILGFVFYIVVSVISAFLVIGVSPLISWNLLLQILIVAGALMSIFFTYLQARVIRAWCFWCLMSAFTTWLMAIIMLVSSSI